MKSQLSKRCGVSLTELMLVLSSCTLILSTSGVLLHRVMRIEIESRTFVDAERACTRLSHQFRNDVHGAVAVDLKKMKLTEGVFLRLQLPENRSVEYAREKGLVRRTAHKGDKVVARDEFPIPPTATITINHLESPNRIFLAIAAPSIDAATDNDARLQCYRAIPVGVQIEATFNQASSAAAQARQGKSP